ncbi:MAG: sortase [Actinomycetota bacterium]
MLRFFGTTFLAAAFVLATYLVWVLWGTGLYTVGAQHDLRTDLQEQASGARPGRVLRGDAYAVLRIPAIGVNAAVVQGTDVESLKKGPGHYLKTGNPWNRRGTVGIAGHRTTYGAWFWSLEELRRGDRIRLITARGTFDYEVDRLRIVAPTAHEVLDFTPKPTLVLTTCNPRFSAAQRLVAFAHRVEVEGGRSEPDLAEGGLFGEGPAVLSTPEGPTMLVAVVGAGGALVALLLGTGTAIRRRRERRSGYEPVR